MRKLVLLAVLGATLIAGVVAALPMVLTLLPLSGSKTIGPESSLPLGVEAYRLGFPEGASEPKIEHWNELDGGLRPRLSYSFSVPGDGKKVRKFYRAACRQNGLGQPSSLQLANDPNALCAASSDTGGEIATISVSPRCSDGQCSVLVELGG